VEAVWALAVAVVAFAAGAATGLIRERRHRAAAGSLVRQAEGAEARARAREDEVRDMETAMSSMQEGVVLFGPDGEATYANPAVATHLGVAPNALDALVPLELRYAARRAALAHLAAEAEAETGSPRRWLRASATPVGSDDSVLLVIRDVTEARRLDAVRRDFVANASHELKTPAASIRAAAETIATAAIDDPEVVPRFAAQLEREAIRLSRIISDLLDLSRLEGGSDLNDDVALEAIVHDESERLADAAAAAGVSIELDLRPARVRGSARDLGLLVRNLLDNAIRYSADGGSVTVALANGDEEAILSVSDTGLGIPTRELSRIFERFYRVDRARSRETGGTGLGLAIVRHIVENHDGEVDVRSELGSGTTFEVRLPSAAGSADAAATTLRG
jgi:signal transduction histidine kinase